MNSLIILLLYRHCVCHEIMECVPNIDNGWDYSAKVGQQRRATG